MNNTWKIILLILAALGAVAAAKAAQKFLLND